MSTQQQPSLPRIYRGVIDRTGDLAGRLIVRVLHYHSPGAISNSYDLRHAVYHSPTGFGAGYPGSGPADLALAILLDLTGEYDKLSPACFTRDAGGAERREIERTVAWILHQDFKRICITLLPRDEGWALHSELLLPWLNDRRKPAEYDLSERTMYDYMGCTVRALPGASIKSFGGEYLAIPEGGINFDVIDVRPVDHEHQRPPRLIMRQNNWPTATQDVWTSRLDNIEFVQFPDEDDHADD